jgi:hypothetical protein
VWGFELLNLELLAEYCENVLKQLLLRLKRRHIRQAREGICRIVL